MNKKTLLFVIFLTLSSFSNAEDLVEGKAYYIYKQASGADLFIKQNNPDWDPRNAFFARLAKPIGKGKPGDTCFFAGGATAIVLGRVPEYGYLVEYSKGVSTRGACPDGAIAFVDPVHISSFKTVPKPTPENLESEADKILRNKTLMQRIRPL